MEKANPAQRRKSQYWSTWILTRTIGLFLVAVMCAVCPCAVFVHFFVDQPSRVYPYKKTINTRGHTQMVIDYCDNRWFVSKTNSPKRSKCLQHKYWRCIDGFTNHLYPVFLSPRTWEIVTRTCDKHDRYEVDVVEKSHRHSTCHSSGTNKEIGEESETHLTFVTSAT